MSGHVNARSDAELLPPGVLAQTAAPGPRPRQWLPGLIVFLLFGVVISAVSFARLPLPPDALKLDVARVSLDVGAFEQVELPHRWQNAGEWGTTLASYSVTLPRIPGEGAVLLIPGARHDLTVTLDGRELLPGHTGLGAVAALGATYAFRLPPVESAQSEIVLRLQRTSGYAPGYLSELYLATEQEFEPLRQIWRLAQSDLHLAIQVLHGTVLISVVMMWLWRRNDPVFGWMALLAGTSFLSDQLLMAFAVLEVRLFALSGFGIISFALALALINAPRPRALKVAIMLVPTLLVVIAQIDLLPAVPAFAFSGLLAVSLCLAGAVLLLRYAWHHREWDRAAMAGFYLSTVWFGLHDFGIALGWIDGARFLSQDMRVLGLLVALFLLLRWLAHSLDAVDQANVTLVQKLAEQRRELHELHLNERRRVHEAALADERQRLIRDLHDGLSGHLVSIIAQSEVGTCDARQIEDTARHALEDLRLVINALDLEDDDLRLALSGLRERVEPQMSRLGIKLDWSMVDLPEVRGIKPGNSLAILRILQEALTNAVKHGLGGPIRVAAHPFGDDRVCLSVSNPSAPAREQGCGHGMRNMQSRASELGGEVRFSNTSGRATLQLIVPKVLHPR
ncbi:ATP-binding protein [Roseinatronobacter sp. NSM]|uniref:ATP-binding protein n=1 Tax=Roseinatronobacter sp. NSM TaxID=3457785 RepID=UPI004035CF83